MILRNFIVSIAALSPGVCLGFVPIPAVRSPFGGTNISPVLQTLRATADGDGGVGGDDRDFGGSPLARNIARTCPKNFLTQRSVQSFMYLLSEIRDPHTACWIENFAGSGEGLLEFHGTGAFNITRFPTWDVFLMQMMVQPTQEITVIIPSRKNTRPRGGSKNNPYLKAEDDQVIEFTIDINPTSLVTRLLSVRNQIAKEWVDDLDTVAQASEMILDSYAARNMNERDEEEEYNPDDDEEDEDEDEDDEDDDDEEEGPPSLSRSPEHFDPASVEGGDMASSSYAGPYSGGGGSTSGAAFDRVAMTMINNKVAFNGGQSSPFRKGNFDLLYLLCTQESVHRVLRDYQQAGEEKDVSFSWLRDFYSDRVADYFDGSLPYGRADDFLEELLLTPPAVVDVGGGKMGLIDTHAIAETLLRMRTEVALEWKGAMEDVPEDHMGLQRALLDVRLEKVESEEPLPEHSEIEEAVEEAVFKSFLGETTEAIGEFE